jgi:hypothetical protein
MLLSLFSGLITGIVIGFLFFNYINDNCIYKGPDSNKEKTKIWEKDGKWYQYETRIVICPSDLRK